jgi:hypothetical protein
MFDETLCLAQFKHYIMYTRFEASCLLIYIQILCFLMNKQMCMYMKAYIFIFKRREKPAVIWKEKGIENEKSV